MCNHTVTRWGCQEVKEISFEGEENVSDRKFQGLGDVDRITAGWPTFSLLVSPKLRLPHPLRFSKGGKLERRRRRRFSVCTFNFCLVTSCANNDRESHPWYPPFEKREGWGSRFYLWLKKGAPRRWPALDDCRCTPFQQRVPRPFGSAQAQVSPFFCKRWTAMLHAPSHWSRRNMDQQSCVCRHDSRPSQRTRRTGHPLYC
jgi:hypothetical protein